MTDNIIIVIPKYPYNIFAEKKGGGYLLNKGTQRTQPNPSQVGYNTQQMIIV